MKVTFDLIDGYCIQNQTVAFDLEKARVSHYA